MGWGLILGQEVENFAVEAEDGRMLHALVLCKSCFPTCLHDHSSMSAGFAALVHACEACSCLLANVRAPTKQSYGVRSPATNGMCTCTTATLNC